MDTNKFLNNIKTLLLVFSILIISLLSLFIHGMNIKLKRMEDRIVEIEQRMEE